jgi:hypothetical protein
MLDLEQPIPPKTPEKEDILTSKLGKRYIQEMNNILSISANKHGVKYTFSDWTNYEVAKKVAEYFNSYGWNIKIGKEYRTLDNSPVTMIINVSLWSKIKNAFNIR